MLVASFEIARMIRTNTSHRSSNNRHTNETLHRLNFDKLRLNLIRARLTKVQTSPVIKTLQLYWQSISHYLKQCKTCNTTETTQHKSLLFVLIPF